MEHRIDEFRWHCGPHPCECADASTAPRAWRYSVIARDCAYSLTISAASGELHLHDRVESSPHSTLEGVAVSCDLKGWMPCRYSAQGGAEVVAPMPPGVSVTEGLLFWGKYAVQGVRNQPPKFWRELERRARAAAKASRAGGYHSTRCPRCLGSGTIVVKPRAKKSSVVKEG